MNIKDKKELYTILWKEARRLYSKYDLCNSKPGTTCLAYQSGRMPTPFCCNGCKYLGAKGCKVQSLACSLCACYFGCTIFSFTKDQNIIKIQKRIGILRKIAYRYDIPVFGRDSKQDCFNKRVNINNDIMTAKQAAMADIQDDHEFILDENDTIIND